MATALCVYGEEEAEEGVNSHGRLAYNQHRGDADEHVAQAFTLLGILLSFPVVEQFFPPPLPLDDESDEEDGEDEGDGDGQDLSDANHGDVLVQQLVGLIFPQPGHADCLHISPVPGVQRDYLALEIFGSVD